MRIEKRRLLLWLGRTITAGFYVAFAILTVLIARSSLWRGGTLLICAAVSFGLVWLLRRLIGRQRPYQNDDALPRLRRGVNDSFPSLHAFSAFYIATAAFILSAAASYLLLAAAALLCTLRVCLSIHYPRDVVGGAFLGVILSIITLILI
jgi:undecaprenyl-diphosphatase